jgi:hypothetical protein
MTRASRRREAGNVGGNFSLGDYGDSPGDRLPFRYVRPTSTAMWVSLALRVV